ncbi:MAG: hypothetical protein P1V97_05945 [Planctomycetota bacterium]|nr:hypothetical protein [Planctomycetota bacterium]
MTEDAPVKKRKRSPAFLVVPILVLIVLTAFVLSGSNLTVSKTTVTFSEDPEMRLNKMTILAPFGAYVHTFTVVPGFSNERPYTIGASMGPGDSFPLFGEERSWSNSIPGSGRVSDIGYGTPVKITNRLLMAAAVSLPKDDAMRANCGKYIWVTKKPKGEADFQAFADNLNDKFEESKKAK